MKKLVFLLFACTLIVVACKKNPKPEEPEVVDAFDQRAMFENYSANLIIPGYQLLKTKLDSLVLKANDFNAIPDATHLATLRQGLFSAYKQYMYVSTFEFGPAATVLFRGSSNVFQTDSTQINGNIASGSYNLALASEADAIGFPALDYILHGKNKTDAYIVNLFATSANRRQYLADVCSKLAQDVTGIVNGWGTYAATFNGATGNSAGSSLSNLVNEMNFDYEITKNARVGIPLGKQTLGVALPERCEAYYSGKSLLLLSNHINAIENIYLGRSQSGADGKGLDDYLDQLNAQYGSTTLNSAIKNKIAEVKAAMPAVPNPLSAAVVSSTAQVETLYQKMQQLQVLLKSDMPSALSVSITYVDGDGD